SVTSPHRLAAGAAPSSFASARRVTAAPRRSPRGAVAAASGGRSIASATTGAIRARQNQSGTEDQLSACEHFSREEGRTAEICCLTIVLIDVADEVVQLPAGVVVVALRSAGDRPGVRIPCDFGDAQCGRTVLSRRCGERVINVVGAVV